MNRFTQIHMRIVAGILFFGLLLYPLPVEPEGIQTIRSIRPDDASETLEIALTGHTPVKIFQAGQKEIVVAFKNTKLAKAATPKTDGSRLIEKIETNRLPGNIVVLDVYTRGLLRKIASEWTDGKRTLAIRLSADRPAAPKRSRNEKTDPPPDPKPVPAPAAIRFPELSIATFEALKEKPTDSIDGMLTDLRTDDCLTHPTIRSAVARFASEASPSAFENLTRYVDADAPGECLETAYYLRGYAFYKQLDPQAEEQNLKAVSLFQEAVSYYPKSRYVPYGVAALGKLNRRLKNYGEAKGYFNVILDSYKTFPGMPEVLLELARLHIDQEKSGIAIATLDRLISMYPNSPMISDAKLTLGKALFEANRFQEALDLFGGLIHSCPRIVYESPELMVYLGNTYYQMGDRARAGDVLVRAVNYFPDLPDVHVLLTRIGDIFHDVGQPEKAEKIYEHVVKNYPGTDGYIVSSVRMAEFLKRRVEKENLYRMIINDFPDHPLTQLAYIKLANLMNREGESEKSIGIVHAFLAKYPGTLKKEAVFVMKEAYEALFRKLSKADDAAGLLTWYERDKSVINRIDSPEIYDIVGTAYRKAHLYEEAANLLEKAYRLYGKDRHRPDLLFNLGVSLMDSGQPDRGIQMLDAYCRKYPKDAHMAQALSRIGRIHMEKKAYKDALTYFSRAYQNTQNKQDKASIRIRQAEACKGLGDHPAAARNLIRAIDLTSGMPEASNATLAKLYRDLGDTYLQAKSYAEAADAFAMAVKFSEQKENPDLRFLLAETYEKGKNIEMAGEVYQQIIDMGDPFWARLAQEKLRGIQLENKLKPNQTRNG